VLNLKPPAQARVSGFFDLMLSVGTACSGNGQQDSNKKKTKILSKNLYSLFKQARTATLNRILSQ
jgi:hypothetical protein